MAMDLLAFLPSSGIIAAATALLRPTATGLAVFAYALLRFLRQLAPRFSNPARSIHGHPTPFVAAEGLKRVAQAGANRLLHHWCPCADDAIILGSGVAAACLCCGESCVGFPFVGAPPALQCLWCQRLVHVRCHGKLMSVENNGVECDLGLLRSIILSPLCVREVDDERQAASSGISSVEVEESIGRRGQLRRRHGRKKHVRKPSATMPNDSLVGIMAINALLGLPKKSKKDQGRKWMPGLDFLKLEEVTDKMIVAAGDDCGNKSYQLINLPADARPLLVLINAKCGDPRILSGLNVLLNPAQVFDVSSSDMLDTGLQLFRKAKHFRVLVCGGDDTVASVLDAIDRHNFEFPPPVAILPIGGAVNDLSHVLCWGRNCGGGGGLVALLSSIECAATTVLDRWNVAIQEDLTNGAETELSERMKVMNSYLGIGCDSHTIHHERDEIFSFQPSLDVLLEVDGNYIEIPNDAQGLLVMNIGSYSGRTDLWRNSCELDDEFCPQAMHDQMLEVVCIPGGQHDGRFWAGAGQLPAKRVAQGKAVRLHLRSSRPVHIDDEPSSIQQPGTIEITHRGQALMLRGAGKKSVGHASAILNDILIDAECSGLINTAQKRALMKELAVSVSSMLSAT